MASKLSHSALIRVGNTTLDLPDTPCFGGLGEILEKSRAARAVLWPCYTDALARCPTACR